MSISAVESSLKAKGYRQTKIRSALLGLLAEGRVYSAADLLASLKKNHRRLHKTTVYRLLDTLHTEGVIRQIEFGDGKKRYERATADHHHHVVCTSCEQIEHVAVAGDLIQEEKKIARETQFKITHHSLEFFGICQRCQSNI